MNPPPAELNELHQRQLTAATAYLESQYQGDQTRGTGYLIAPDLVATCSHVVPGDAAFEKIYRKHITAAMTFTQKINLLLMHANRNEVLGALRREYPEEVSAHEAAIQYELLRGPY